MRIEYQNSIIWLVGCTCMNEEVCNMIILTYTWNAQSIGSVTVGFYERKVRPVIYFSATSCKARGLLFL